MRIGRLWFLFMALTIAGAGAGACDKDDGDDEASEPPSTGNNQAIEQAEPGSPEAPALPSLTGDGGDCAELRITIDGDPLPVGSIHAYTGVSFQGQHYGEFVRASQAADETCDEILANTGVTRDGRQVRYVTAFKSPRSDTYDTLMISGWSQTNIPLTYDENDDGTRTICVTEETTFTGPGDREYVVVGELTGPYCGEMRL